MTIPKAWRSALAAALLAAALGAPSGAAAGEAADGPVEVIRLSLRPGTEADAERFLAALADAARRTGAGVRWRTLGRSDGDAVEYVVVLQARDAAELDAWADFNASEVLERAYGAARARELLALRERSLARLARERLAPRPELGFEGPR